MLVNDYQILDEELAIKDQIEEQVLAAKDQILKRKCQLSVGEVYWQLLITRIDEL